MVDARPAGPQHRAPTLPLRTAGPGAATGPPLSLSLFAFLKTLFLQSGFKLTEKLRRYRDSPPISTHVQPLPLWTFLPPPAPPSGTFVTSDTPESPEVRSLPLGSLSVPYGPQVWTRV